MRFLLLLGVFAFAVAADQTSTASAHDREGQAAFAAGRYRDAKSHFERALEQVSGLRPEERVAVLANLGQACQALGELARAEQFYRRALIDMPDHSTLLNLLGGVLAQQQRFDEAGDALRRSISAAPNERAGAAARSDLATLLEAQGKRREAAALLEEAIGAAPAGQARARMLANLGGLRLKLGQREAAVAALRRSLTEMEAAVGAMHPDMATVLMEYSEVLRKAGLKQEAKQAALRAGLIQSYSVSQTNANGATVNVLDLAK